MDSKKLPLKKWEPFNIERKAKENLKKKAIVFKGNDLTVDAVDILLTSYEKT